MLGVLAHGAAGRAAFENHVFRRGPVIVAVIWLLNENVQYPIAPAAYVDRGDRGCVICVFSETSASKLSGSLEQSTWRKRN